MQIGYTGQYMRFRYTYSDHSLDFNIMNYKGSVQFRGNPDVFNDFMTYILNYNNSIKYQTTHNYIYDAS